MEYEMKTFALDFEKIKNDFSYVVNNDGTMTFRFPIIVSGDTGRDMKLQGVITSLLPPEGFENILMVIRHTVEGRGSSKYYNSARYQLNSKINRYKIPIPAIEIGIPNYIGVIENRIDRKAEYKPFIYEIKPMESEPVVVEYNEASDQKRNFFEINGEYYMVTADPIRDVTKGKALGKKEKLLADLNNKIPLVINEDEAKKNFPPYLYKGYASVDYFNDKLYFERYYHGKDWIVVRNEKKPYSYTITTTPGFLTANQFYYAYEERFPMIRKILQIKDERVLGEELFEFKPGDEVEISDPSAKCVALKGITGVVEEKALDKVKVKFLGYFTEIFSPNEIKKIKVLTN